MKLDVIIFSTALLMVSCATEKATVLGDTVKLGKNYGPIEVRTDEAVDASEVRVMSSKIDGDTEMTFEGTIVEVCSKAGCWVNIDDGMGNTFMVRFKDHFTIPTDTKPGTKAYFHGVAFNDTVSVEMLQHFAEDAGKSQAEIDAITEQKIDLGFTADGIALKK